MRRNLLRQILAASLVTILMSSVGDCFAESQGKPARVPSQGAVDHAVRGKSLPGVFVSVVPEIKARSRITILLPSELSEPIGKAKHALLEKATPNEYAISLYYELGVGDAGFAAFFAAQGKPKFDPRELPDVEPVNLAHGLHGFFRAVSCGGSCAPANLWWEENGVLYQVQLE